MNVASRCLTFPSKCGVVALKVPRFTCTSDDVFGI